MPGAAIGAVGCDRCGETCAVREQKNGLATYSCQWCGWQGYSRGSVADRHLRSQMTAHAVEAGDPKTPQETPAAPAAAPAPKPKGKDDGKKFSFARA